MNKKTIILCIFFVFLCLIPFFYHTAFSKYIFDYTFVTTNICIDKKPKIEVISVSNTNTGYEKYANYTHEVHLKVKVVEKNITINNFNSDNINVFINNEQSNSSLKINLISNHYDEKIYDILLSNLTGNGNLSIVFPEGIIQDNLNQKNEFLKFDTGILIDNLSPNTTCKESPIENNQSKYSIFSNECLRPIESWEISQDLTSLSKVFCSPILYPINITDFAGNTSEVFVDIQNAKNIMLYYANYNGYRFSKFDSNGQISGKQAIIDNNNQKSEMIFAYLDGDIDKQLLEGRIFDYTYWGENSTARCNYSEIPYQYGYSPSATSWYDINSKNAVYCLGKLCFQLGGQGHNLANNSCLGSFNPIPEEIAKKNLYGISGIAFNLKNSDTYSIVYQIYIPDIGWLKAASDGEESTYSHDKPFSAIRINIVPKSEKQYLMNYWNRVIYTNYVD